MNKTDCKKVKGIKLIIVGILILFLLCSMVFVEASSSADAMVDLIDATSREVYDDTGTCTFFIDISFRVTNQLAESKIFEPYVAFYTSQNQLRDLKFADAKTIANGGSAEFLVKSDVSIEEEGISVKVFVWDDNYAPCADIVLYSIDKGNTTLSVAGTTIENKSFATLTITEDIGDGEVTLNNVSVDELIIEGGGSNSIKLKGCTVRNKITAQKKSGNAPRILLENTPVDKIEIIKPAIIEAVDTTSVISEIVTVEEVKIQGANTRVKKLEIDEETEKEIGIGVPDGMELELEINSDNGFELIEGTVDNFEFSTACEDIAEEILETIKDIVSHIHIWKEEAEITLGYKTYKCSCSEIKNPSDRVVSFNVSDFASLDSSAGELKYFSDKENGVIETVKLDIDEDELKDFILYNGSVLDSKNPADYIGNNYSAVIMVNSTYSGRVVLIDNDFEAGYDIISIEMPVYGVVDEVKSNGRVVFNNVVRDPYTHETARIFVNGEDYNSILTKNGKPISGSELKENDVLSVMWNPDVWNMKKFCYVEVVDKKIEGSVTVAKTSLTSASNNAAYCLNNVTDKFYDVGYNAYRNAEIKLGAEGAFVIDKYDKIVAFFKAISDMHGNYGYVLAAIPVVDDWGRLNVRMQILDDSGEVYDTYLANEVEIPNAPYDLLWNTFVDDGQFLTYPPANDIYCIEDFALDRYDPSAITYSDITDTGASEFAATIQNQLINYKVNAAGKISGVGFATMDEWDAEEYGWLYKAAYSTSGNSYGQEDSQLIANGRFDITDDTLVFCINGNSGSLELGDYTMASKALSGVTDREILSKISDTTPVAVYDVNGKDEASVVVIYNVEYEREEAGGEQVSTDCGYGYVLAATAISDDWGKTNVRMQILDDSGEVYETCLANEVEISNYADLLTASWNYDGMYEVEEFEGYYDYNCDVFDIQDFVPETGATAFATAIQNQLITYKTNTSGEISGIGFATWDEDAAEENGWLYIAAYSTENNAYDETAKKVTVDGNQFTLTEDTKVFYINSADGYPLGLGYLHYASKTDSKVDKIGSIRAIDSATPVAVYDVNENDEAAVVVMYNRGYGISPNANVAVIDSVGSAIDENGKKVAYVKYFMNGEKRSATTDVNLPAASKTAISCATQGDVFRFSFDESGNKIMAAQQCIDYTGYGYTNLPNSAVVMPSYDRPLSNIAGGSSVVYGPAIKYNSSNKITLAAWSTDHWDLDASVEAATSVKATEANVYVFDQNKIANRLYVGEAGDIYIDENVIKKTTSQEIKVGTTTIVGTTDSVVGLLDYVAGFKNADGEVIDIVIYKPYDFGIYSVY